MNLGMLEKGDEVIVPAATFSSVVSPIYQLGLKPVYVDVSSKDWFIDIGEIERAITSKTRVIMPVYNLGFPGKIEEIVDLAKDKNLKVLEDCCEAHGGERQGKKLGSFGELSALSFFVAHNITTGEGGIVTTNNKKWGDWINSYKHFGMDMSGASREGIHFNIIGTNYKLTNIQAAVGLGKLENIEELLNKRISLANNYKKLIKNIEKISLPQVLNPKPNCQHSFQTYIVYVEERDRIMSEMRSKGIEVQIGSYSLHMHNAYNNNPLVEIKGNLSNSKWCFEHALALPLYNDLTEELQEIVVKELKYKN